MVEATLSFVMQVIDEASSNMEKIRGSMGILGNSLQELGGGFGSLGNVMTGFAAGGPIGAAAAGFGELVSAVKWSVSEAGASEQAFTNLGEAVKRSGIAWTDVEAKTRGYLTELQRTTVYSDEALAGMVERLLTFGMSYDQAMTAAGTALDLAAAKHMDLQNASDVLGKAFMGNTALLKRYGIDIEDVGGKSATFTDIMGKMNEQFGGTAQAQAQTYTGIQERLKNATSELGEKIGGMLLPSLAGLTEAMIPVVDSFGRGIDALQNWLSAVAKMPEVKAATDALGAAFSSLSKYLVDTWDSVKADFGPALEELRSAFKELWDALQPVFEAFGELMKAFGASGEGINSLKLLLQGLVLGIRAIAEGIHLAIPVIRLFAEGFKTAADIIAPPLKFIAETVNGFIRALTGAFQGFYDWLVGHSLWQSLWNGLKTVATQGIALIGDIMGAGFKAAFAIVQSVISSAAGILTGIIGTLQSLMAGTTKTWLDLVNAIMPSIEPLKATLQGLADKVSATAKSMQSTWGGALSAMVSATQSSFQQMVWNINSQVDAIINKLRAAQNEISKHSIWPDMLNEMVMQTQGAMADIRGEFSQGLGGPGGVIPTLQAAQPAVAGGFGGGAAASAPQRMQQSISLPINVYLDGQQIQQLLERRLVDTLYQNANRSKRG